MSDGTKAGCFDAGCRLRIGIPKGMCTTGGCRCTLEIERALRADGMSREDAFETRRAIDRLAMLAEQNRDKTNDPAYVIVRWSDLNYIRHEIEQARAVASFKAPKARLLAMLDRILEVKK